MVTQHDQKTGHGTEPCDLFSWLRVSWLRGLLSKLNGLFLRPRGQNTGRRQDSGGLGQAGEKAAASFLRQLGYRILAHGHRQRLGEIDLIALDGKCIVFVEVKTWTSASAADPSEAVNRSKQEKLTRAALIYLKQKKLLEHPARFDVVSIVWPSAPSAQPEIRHFINAFEAVGHWQMYR